MMPRQNLVVDGRERQSEAVRAEVTAVVEAEFGDRLARASFVARIRIRRTMRREIAQRVERRMREATSPFALY
jgi:hypothetical protein